MGKSNNDHEYLSVYLCNVNSGNYLSVMVKHIKEVVKSKQVNGFELIKIVKSHPHGFLTRKILKNLFCTRY